MNSSLINMAYELLASPTQRAAYLVGYFLHIPLAVALQMPPQLNLHGVNILEEGRTFQNPTLLSEVMELREEIEDAKSPQEAEAVASRLDPLIQSTSRQVLLDEPIAVMLHLLAVCRCNNIWKEKTIRQGRMPP